MSSSSQYFPVVALAVVAAATAQDARAHDDDRGARYSVVEITVPPDPECIPGYWQGTVARRLNERGEVVGDDICNINYTDPQFPILPGGGDAFRWSARSGATMLGAFGPEPVEQLGRDINELGTAVGWEFLSDGSSFAPVWPRAGGVSLAFQPQPCPFIGTFSFGDGINDLGAVLGRDQRPNANGGCSLRWVLKLATGEEILGPTGGARALNNNNVGVGQSGPRAIRWSPASGEVVLYSDPTGLTSGIGWAINDRNEAVGYITTSDPQTGCPASQQAASWAANGRQTNLKSIRGHTHAVAFGINNRSQVVGGSWTQNPCGTNYDSKQARAIIWKGTHPVELNTLVPKRFAREFNLEIASAINDRGQIVARGPRRNEPRSPCPSVDSDPDTGESIYNPSTTCQNIYSFLLTPKN